MKYEAFYRTDFIYNEPENIRLLGPKKEEKLLL